MLPASNRGVGMNIGFPDVCLTPMVPAPVPIPYPNFAMNAMAAAFSPIVKISGVPALNLGSIIPMTSGDEPGTAHWTFKGMGRYVMGNPIVFVDRMPAISLTCPTTGNLGNNALGAVLVPSAVNVFYTYAHSPEAAVSAEQAAELGETISGRGQGPLSADKIGDDLGYLRVELITTDIASRFVVAAEALVHEGARALCIDLRGCPGGDLDGLVSWASLFLDAGAEVVQIEDAEGDRLVRRASLPATYSIPVVVLVDHATASAAELFAACMKAHGRAKILGERTYGKGSVQSFTPGDEGAFAYGTLARCFGPGDAPIDGVGVEPDDTLDVLPLLFRVEAPVK